MKKIALGVVMVAMGLGSRACAVVGTAAVLGGCCEHCTEDKTCGTVSGLTHSGVNGCCAKTVGAVAAAP